MKQNPHKFTCRKITKNSLLNMYWVLINGQLYFNSTLALIANGILRYPTICQCLKPFNPFHITNCKLQVWLILNCLLTKGHDMKQKLNRDNLLTNCNSKRLTLLVDFFIFSYFPMITRMFDILDLVWNYLGTWIVL